MTRLVLGSRSPARLATLRAAGLDPLVLVSDLDESRVQAEAEAKHGPLDFVDVPIVLAQAKADHIARLIAEDAPETITWPDRDNLLVIGCDSVFEFDGELLGKPLTEQVARTRARSMSGRSGILHTGHWLIDIRDAEHNGSHASTGATTSTTVHFGTMSDAEIDAYIDSGEPLQVAGGFTIDGLGGPFIDGIEGDHHSVVGISLPLLRQLLAEVSVSIVDLWTPR